MLRRGWKTNQPRSTTFIVPTIISLTFQNLPVEMMEHIFSHLSDVHQLKASWVCKLHREIIYKKFGPALLNYQLVIDEERRRSGCLSLIMCKTAISSEFYGTMLNISCINISACNTNPAITGNDDTQDINDPTLPDKPIVSNNNFTFFAEFKEKTGQVVECKKADNDYLLSYMLN